MIATIKDVAKKAGVSISTVSRVVNDSKPVSEEVRKKVEKAIEELGYKPNEVARSLVTKKSSLIGVIVTDLGNSYVAEMLRGIEEIGRMYDYDILLSSTFGEMQEEVKSLQVLRSKQVEGIILISDNLNEELDQNIDKINMPFIYLNRYYYNEKYPSVIIDNEGAAYEMTNYLINSGHQDIIYVVKSREENSIEKKKLDGYKKAIEENGLEKMILYAEDIGYEQGYNVGRDIIESKATAVFCSYDEIAIGVLGYLYDKGVKVPEEISITGFGDINTSSILRPTLTTIKVPYYDIGAVAVRRIIKELKGDKLKNEDTLLPFQIQVRGSSIEI
ncbi:MAG: LacI family DNA-binding transcriptional regulator [Andreesenia angusta]|nr:LacI family DNA-binding transcriptional regulator [Andreesenia angusta]